MLLKEVMCGKGQRIAYPCNSPNGVCPVHMCQQQVSLTALSISSWYEPDLFVMTWAGTDFPQQQHACS